MSLALHVWALWGFVGVLASAEFWACNRTLIRDLAKRAIAAGVPTRAAWVLSILLNVGIVETVFAALGPLALAIAVYRLLNHIGRL
jgi:hypothetical protein